MSCTSCKTDTVALPDGAKLAYDVFGAEHLPTTSPIVLVGGVILVYDHRGMGDSRLANRDEKHTIELLARDLLFLIQHLGWKQISLCGFSMGGVVVQQLILLPYHPTEPTSLPFTATHVILAGSLCEPLRDKRFGLPPPPPAGTILSEQEKMDIAREMLSLSYDPAWLADPGNAGRIQEMLGLMVAGRPRGVILKQMRAMNRFDFADQHTRLPRSMQFLVIHGTLDRIVPPSCGEEILRRIPWARSLDIDPAGNKRGTVPNVAFGHSWYEYFDVRVWVDVIEGFAGGGVPLAARL
ncbi:Hydrolase-4 domain-containing protein [Mycena chlorophos]|uniref:Hydrolase-4 domain-containing protein n=1 Tax=Mycena chlorophos TaxID=658473 RepID=A0A8H6TT65_MYCCL|nr:Hydrolase-4 domain-containing protein [Mycena chlorophos]